MWRDMTANRSIGSMKMTGVTTRTGNGGDPNV